MLTLKDEDDPTTLLDHLNTQDTRIKFTMEIEQNKHLPFLDVQVNRDNDGLHTGVYRKPTHTDQYIHFNSQHPNKIKTGIISTLTRRAVNVCSEPKALKQELTHLQRCIHHPKQVSINYREQCEPQTRHTSPIFIKLPFEGKISQDITRLLRRLAGAEVIFTTGPTLKTLLSANGKQAPTTSPDPKGVIYNINCSCGENYIGETGRPLAKRIEEHKASVRKADQKSAISEHLLENPNHRINWDDITKLTTRTTTIERKLTEAIYIKRLKPKLNRDQGLMIPTAYEQLIN